MDPSTSTTLSGFLTIGYGGPFSPRPDSYAFSATPLEQPLYAIQPTDALEILNRRVLDSLPSLNNSSNLSSFSEPKLDLSSFSSTLLSLQARHAHFLAFGQSLPVIDRLSHEVFSTSRPPSHSDSSNSSSSSEPELDLSSFSSTLLSLQAKDARLRASRQLQAIAQLSYAGFLNSKLFPNSDSNPLINSDPSKRISFLEEISSYLKNPFVLFTVNHAWRESGKNIGFKIIERGLPHNKALEGFDKEKESFLKSLSSNFYETLAKAQEIAHERLRVFKLLYLRSELVEHFGLNDQYDFKPINKDKINLVDFQKVNFLTLDTIDYIYSFKELRKSSSLVGNLLTPINDYYESKNADVDARVDAHQQKMTFRDTVDILKMLFYIMANSSFSKENINPFLIENKKIFCDINQTYYNEELIQWKVKNDLEIYLEKAIEEYDDHIQSGSGVGLSINLREDKFIDVNDMSYALFTFVDLILRCNYLLSTERVEIEDEDEDEDEYEYEYEDKYAEDKLKVLQTTLKDLERLYLKEKDKLEFILQDLQKDIRLLKQERITYIQQTLKDKSKNPEDIYWHNLCVICPMIWPNLIDKALIRGEFL